ncbi:MAG: hypothetical protein IJT16_07350 [Lachnospiraceae bacterium]|nr:hypothetical protein [Lachnospiraceae bacterium]
MSETPGLKDYVGLVKRLECLCYEETNSINYLKRQFVNVDNPRYYENHQVYKCEDARIHRSARLGFINSFLICVLVSLSAVLVWSLIRYTMIKTSNDASLSPESPGTVLLLEAFKYAPIIGGLASCGAAAFLIVGSVRTTMKDKREQREQKRKEEEARLRVSQENSLIDARNQQKKEYLIKRNSFFEKELQTVEANARNTKAILDKTYELGVIHEKYRHNLPYICSIYEYFDTGRCNSLEGHEGAYNLLESDIKYNIILDRLDIIIEKLEEIKDNQRELYSSMSEINNNIKKMSNSVSTLSNKLDKGFERVEDAVERVEYNTELSTKNTEFIKWYQYYSGVYQRRQP